MIATVYTKEGIVLSTLSCDTFYETQEINDTQVLCPIISKGFSHVITLWDKYVFIYRSMNSFRYDDTLIKWQQTYQEGKRNVHDIDTVIKDLMNIICDEKLDIFGMLAGYEKSTPYVYAVQGESYRRLNINDNQEIIYNCSFYERKEVVGKLFRDLQVKNGEEWELRTGVRTRCDLFSLRKAMDLCHFLLSVNYHINNINSSLFEEPLEYETIVIKENSIQII